jgi:hypothetical protein
VLLAALGHDGVPAEQIRRGDEALRRALDDPRWATRALFALAVAAYTSGDTAAADRLVSRLEARRAGDAGAARLGYLLAGLAAGARNRPAAALAASAPLLAWDSGGRAGDPFARSLLHLHRGRWLAALGRAGEAEAEWGWYENADGSAWFTGPAQAGDVDWALGTQARWWRARSALARGERAGGCVELARVLVLWAGGEPALEPRRREAQELAARHCGS